MYKDATKIALLVKTKALTKKSRTLRQLSIRNLKYIFETDKLELKQEAGK
jgi:hydroxyacyl-ACP dehydratase HTD2-like protein with hotdog domain